MVTVYHRTKCTGISHSGVVQKKMDWHRPLLELRSYITLQVFCETYIILTVHLCCLGISKLPVCYYQLFKRELDLCVCGLESFVAFSVTIFLSKIAGRCNEIILNTAVLYLSTLIVPATSAGS